MLFRNQHIHNQRGETLITVMIATSIGIIISLAMASVMSDMFKGSSTALFHSDAETARSLLQVAFSNRPICRGNLGGIQFESMSDPNSIPDLPPMPTAKEKSELEESDPPPHPGLPANFRFLKGVGSLDDSKPIVENLDFESVFYRLRNIQKTGTTGTTVSAIAELELYFKSRKNVFGSNIVKRVLAMQIQVDNTTRKLTDCTTDPAGSAAGGATIFFPTVDEINNGGGTPCHNLCSGDTNTVLNASIACAGRYCRNLKFRGGVLQEYGCSSGLSTVTTVVCF